MPSGARTTKLKAPLIRHYHFKERPGALFTYFFSTLMHACSSTTLIKQPIARPILRSRWDFFTDPHYTVVDDKDSFTMVAKF